MMVTDEQIKNARKTLERKWSSEGECRSCGWHASLYEYAVEDREIEKALENGGVLELCCLGDDYEGTDLHRGVRVYLQ